MASHSLEIHGTGWISWSSQWRKYSVTLSSLNL